MPLTLVAAALLSAPLSKQGKGQVLKADSSKPCDKWCSDMSAIFKQHSGKTMGWQARCEWENCQGCSACENKAWLNEGTGPDDTEDLVPSKKEGGAAATGGPDDGEAHTEPTELLASRKKGGGPDDGEAPLAAPAYDPEHGSCHDWCKPAITHVNGTAGMRWDEKCMYLTCQACTGCQNASAARAWSEPTAFPPQPSPMPAADSGSKKKMMAMLHTMMGNAAQKKLAAKIACNDSPAGKSAAALDAETVKVADCKAAAMEEFTEVASSISAAKKALHSGDFIQALTEAVSACPDAKCEEGFKKLADEADDVPDEY